MVDAGFYADTLKRQYPLDTLVRLYTRAVREEREADAESYSNLVKRLFPKWTPPQKDNEKK